MDASGDFMTNPGRSCAGVDPNVFFNPDDSSPDTQYALWLCSQCVVREPCLRWALDHDEKGVWGGFTARSRNRIRRGPRQPRATAIPPPYEPLEARSARRTAS
jgi:WhiB family transcriptional regulator, redox-sensing transcriptional regulator